MAQRVRRNKNLEWFAFEYDFNKRDVVRINVLGTYFAEDMLKRVKRDKLTTYNDIKEGIKRELMYHYWCKAEHEILVTDLFPKDFEKESVKLDVWFQLEPNLDRITEYVIRELKLEIE